MTMQIKQIKCKMNKCQNCENRGENIVEDKVIYQFNSFDTINALVKPVIIRWRLTQKKFTENDITSAITSL